MRRVVIQEHSAADGDDIRIQLPPNMFRVAGVADQTHVLMEALSLYADRNRRYRDNWRRYGWRGGLFRLRERADRAWDVLFDAHTPKTASAARTVLDFESADAGVDDLIDLINLTSFAVRAVRENNRDGEGSWW
jgi:hypothetical protein